MTKTLKDLFEVYKPKSPDEQKFVDKHVTIKHKDRNGNGDEVFNASNVKTIKRKEENHGYDSGEDEKVYEAVLAYDADGKIVGRYKDMKTATEMKPGHRYVEESAEQIDEASTPALNAVLSGHAGKTYREVFAKHGDKLHGMMQAVKKERDEVAKAAGSSRAAMRHDTALKAYKSYKNNMQEELELEEKKLTPAEMKKREEVAKAIERENPKMPMAKKMAIATATAKKVAEEVEDLEELSRATIGRYSMKAKSIADNEGGKDRSKGRELAGRKRWGGTMSGVEKAKVMASEEAELEEGSYKDGDTRMGSVGPITTDAERAERAKKYREKMMKKESADYLETDLKKRKKNNDKAVEDMKKMGSPMKNPHFGEEVELDEVSAATLRSYTDKASDARGHRNLPTAKLDKRYKGVALAHEKIRGRHAQVPANEEVENVEEAIGDVTVTKISSADSFKKHTGQMTPKAKTPVDPRTGKTLYQKVTKEHVINNAIEKFMPELEDYKPMAQEEKLVAKLDGLSESHIHLLLGLFGSLNEENKSKMLDAVNTREGINSLIDFALNNRGE